MKIVNIHEAILVKHDTNINNMQENKGQKVCKQLCFTTIKTINCVIDEARGNAIDLETGCVYHIIQRNNWGIVSKEEAQIIRDSEKDSLFVYKFYEKNMKDISLLYQMLLKSRAQIKYQEYLQSIGNKKVEKVKKIGKKERK